MRLWALALGAVAVLAADAAAAAPEIDPARVATVTERFKPFDAMTSQGWSEFLPAAEVRSAAAGGADAVQFDLKPGAYMVVALCNCEQMDVTLVKPDSSEPPPMRSSDQAAMYSLDVSAPGHYLVGVDMGACAGKTCDFAVKVYRKQ